MLVDGYSSTVVDYGDRTVFFQIYLYCCIMSSQVLVDGVVYNLPDAVMQSRTVVRIPQVHPGALPHGL